MGANTGRPGRCSASPRCEDTAAAQRTARDTGHVPATPLGRPPGTCARLPDVRPGGGKGARGRAAGAAGVARGAGRAPGPARPVPVGHSCRHAQHLSAVCRRGWPLAAAPLRPRPPPSPLGRCALAGGSPAGRGGTRGWAAPPSRAQDHGRAVLAVPGAGARGGRGGAGGHRTVLGPASGRLNPSSP